VGDDDEYIIERKLGVGYFSTVWLASNQFLPNTHLQKLVAIKVSKSKQSFQEAAQDEIKILTELGHHPNIVSLLDKFILPGPLGLHYCLVFDPMWKDLEYLVRTSGYRGFPPEMLKTICYQILCGIEFMHSKQIIHTDIKPENFLVGFPYKLDVESIQQEREYYLELVRNSHHHPNSDKKLKKIQKKLFSSSFPVIQWPTHDELIVKIADFGNACWTFKHFTPDIQTRQYRSPEVLLGYPYGTEVDIFSCGATFFELATGNYLFNPKNYSDINIRNEHHLYLMVQVMGPLPTRLVKYGKFGSNYFNRQCDFLHFDIRTRTPIGISAMLTKYNYNYEDRDLLGDFLSHCLEMDPTRRWTATQLKSHPYFSEYK
jgi:serine/threonine-protein kinase SRPK3